MPHLRSLTGAVSVIYQEERLHLHHGIGGQQPAGGSVQKFGAGSSLQTCDRRATNHRTLNAFSLLAIGINAKRPCPSSTPPRLPANTAGESLFPRSGGCRNTVAVPAAWRPATSGPGGRIRSKVNPRSKPVAGRSGAARRQPSQKGSPEPAMRPFWRPWGSSQSA